MKFTLRRWSCFLLALAFQPFAQGVTATGLGDFEGREEPLVIYHPATHTFQPDSFINITQSGEKTFRMTLRFNGAEGWDGDRNTTNNDRQRAEVKGLGPHQKHGDTFEYTTTWRSNPSFVGSPRFCHIFQLKATDGDNGAPLVTLSIQAGTSHAAVHYWSGTARSSTAARSFDWAPGNWETTAIRIKTSPAKDGLVTASINGDAFAGATDVAVFRPDATDYRPKWGLYRGASAALKMGDDWIEHRDVTAAKINP